MFCKDRGLDHTKTSFRFGRQVERVTKQCDYRQAAELTLMDTPGTNDIQTELSDYDILKMKNENLAAQFQDPERGVSAIVQCVMIDAGGRIKQTSIESMARTFHSLTYSHPDFNPMESEGPRLSVVFTNFSRFHEVQDNIMIPGIESVSKYEIVDRFSELIKKFKNEICQKIYHDLGEK